MTLELYHNYDKNIYLIILLYTDVHLYLMEDW